MKIRIYPQSLLETVWQQDKLLFTPEAAQPPLCLRCGPVSYTHLALPEAPVLPA